MLCSKVYKFALLYETNIPRLNKKRNTLWIKLLGIDTDNRDYFAFRDKVNSKNDHEKTFEDDGKKYKANSI